MLDLPSIAIAVEPTSLERWTVDAYHQMSALGILETGERTELIAGQITVMTAKGTPHVSALRLLATHLDAFLLDRPFFAITQDPIHLDDLSEPEPDLAVVRGRALDYASHHPQPEDIALIVEVADSTLKQDCTIKDKLYAQAGITNYWVQDLKNQQLHVFRKPTASSYGSHTILSMPNQASPLAFPKLNLELSSIFPPFSR